MTPGRLKPHNDTEIDEEKIILKQVTIIFNNSAMKMLTVCALLCAMVALTGAYILPETTTTPNLPVTEDHFGGWRPYCPDGWTMFNTRCLLYVPKIMTWAQAEQHCKYMNGNLASVINTQYSDEIRKVLQSAGQKSKQIWVGGYNTPERPSWSWTDPFISHGFHDWCIHSTVEPKNHCLQITFEENASGCLDDMQCDAELPSVCSIVIM
ncbi:type-2 ice-structuring protein isoform X2 [Perca flavescens]|uniref:type-2 ice-structuring protein isoform X2 n=1 Tax=Perca flavescens TaxID=8167 RepID=UPI00106DE123|nr:type-2 ice-structuring protein-like isoform X2 [Perca flavescens]